MYDPDGNVIGRYRPGAFSNSTANASYLIRTDFDADGRPTARYVPRYDSAHGDMGVDSSLPSIDAQGGQCPKAATPVSPYSWLPSYTSDVGVCSQSVLYDADGNITKISLPTSAGFDSTGAPKDNRYVAYSYTDDNLVATLDAPSPASAGARVDTTYLYDGDRRTVQQVAPFDAGDGYPTIQTQTAYTADGLTASQTGQSYTAGTTAINHQTTYSYDANGNRTVTDDPIYTAAPTSSSANQATVDYTADNLRADVINGSNDSTGQQKTSYSYDADGNPVDVYAPAATAKVAPNTAGTPTANTYTADDLLATSTAPPGYQGNSRRTVYGYDHGGRTVSEDTVTVNSSGAQVADAGTQTYAYFADDRLQSQTGRGGHGTISFTYDLAGSPIDISDSTSGIDVQASFYLDELNRTTGDDITNTTASKGRIDQFTYDGAGQPTARSDGNQATNVYYTTTYEYTDAGTPSQVISDAAGGAKSTITATVGGQLASETLGNGDMLAYKYNPDGTLNAQQLTQGSGSSAVTVAAYTYGTSYDNDYRPLQQQFTSNNTLADQDTYGFRYNQEAQLSAFTVTAGSTTTTNNVTFDRDGNRTGYGPAATASGCASTATSGTTCATYNPDDSLASTTAGGTQRAVTQATFGGVADDGCYTYGYDGFDRLTGATAKTGATGCPSTTSGVYKYDGLNRQRVDETDTNGVKTANVEPHYNGLTDTISVEASTVGTAVDTAYELLPDGSRQAVTQKTAANPTTQYLIGDGLGSITDAINTSGGVACAVRLDPFGSPQKGPGTSACNTGTSVNDFWYQGGRQDPNTGQYQFGARTYDPAKASWLTPDAQPVTSRAPNGALLTDPLTQNSYAYVNGDPVTLNDLTGHYPCSGRDVAEGCLGPNARRHPDQVYQAWVREINYYDGNFNQCELDAGGDTKAIRAECNFLAVGPTERVHWNWGVALQAVGLLGSALLAGPEEIGAEAALEGVSSLVSETADVGLYVGTGAADTATVAADAGSLAGEADVAEAAATEMRAVDEAKALGEREGFGAERVSQRDAAEGIPADAVRFSQRSVNGAADKIATMQEHGWVEDPVDVVRMPDNGLTSVDNTRLLAARYTDTPVQAVLHDFDESLPQDFVDRFIGPKGEMPTTWGEAVMNRIAGQGSIFSTRYPFGSPFTGWNGG